EAWRTHPDRGIRLDAHPYFSVWTKLGLHLPLEDFGVGPVVLARRHIRLDYAPHTGRRADALAIGLVSGPVSPQRQSRAVTVLAIDHDVLVHHQVQQHQYLGEQHDDQHHPQGASEEALRKPERGFHRSAEHRGWLANRKHSAWSFSLQLLVAIGYEHVAHAPDRLDIARLGRIRLDQAAQAGDLHGDGTLQRI